MLQRKPPAAVKHQLDGACCLMGEHTFEAIRCSISLLAMEGTVHGKAGAVFTSARRGWTRRQSKWGSNSRSPEEKHRHAK